MVQSGESGTETGWQTSGESGQKTLCHSGAFWALGTNPKTQGDGIISSDAGASAEAMIYAPCSIRWKIRSTSSRTSCTSVAVLTLKNSVN